MSRVRADLGASLHLGDGRVLNPGDEVPEGVVVDGHALEVEKAEESLVPDLEVERPAAKESGSPASRQKTAVAKRPADDAK